MALAMGDIAPDFHAGTSEGPIDFHQWIGGSWAVLFSHRKDFTPVCTTELGYMAKVKPDFDARGMKIIGLSVDSAGDHQRWAAGIAACPQAGASPAPHPAALAAGGYRARLRLGW
jgi:alkyl hydroperoxide reductase subunit AhpC